ATRRSPKSWPCRRSRSTVRSWPRTPSRRPCRTTAPSMAARRPTPRNPRPPRRTDMAVTLTQQAANHVDRYLRKRGKGVGLRLGVRTTGCSGMAYKLEYVDEPATEDTVFESFGVKVFVDPKSMPYLD